MSTPAHKLTPIRPPRQSATRNELKPIIDKVFLNQYFYLFHVIIETLVLEIDAETFAAYTKHRFVETTNYFKTMSFAFQQRLDAGLNEEFIRSLFAHMFDLDPQDPDKIYKQPTAKQSVMTAVELKSLHQYNHNFKGQTCTNMTQKGFWQMVERWVNVAPRQESVHYIGFTNKADGEKLTLGVYNKHYGLRVVNQRKHTNITSKEREININQILTGNEYYIQLIHKINKSDPNIFSSFMEQLCEKYNCYMSKAKSQQAKRKIIIEAVQSVVQLSPFNDENNTTKDLIGYILLNRLLHEIHEPLTLLASFERLLCYSIKELDALITEGQERYIQLLCYKPPQFRDAYMSKEVLAPAMTPKIAMSDEFYKVVLLGNWPWVLTSITARSDRKESVVDAVMRQNGVDKLVYDFGTFSMEKDLKHNSTPSKLKLKNKTAVAKVEPEQDKLGQLVQRGVSKINTELSAVELITGLPESMSTKDPINFNKNMFHRTLMQVVLIAAITADDFDFIEMRIKKSTFELILTHKQDNQQLLMPEVLKVFQNKDLKNLTKTLIKNARPECLEFIYAERQKFRPVILKFIEHLYQPQLQKSSPHSSCAMSESTPAIAPPKPSDENLLAAKIDKIRNAVKQALQEFNEHIIAHEKNYSNVQLNHFKEQYTQFKQEGDSSPSPLNTEYLITLEALQRSVEKLQRTWDIFIDHQKTCKAQLIELESQIGKLLEKKNKIDKIVSSLAEKPKKYDAQLKQLEVIDTLKSELDHHKQQITILTDEFALQTLRQAISRCLLACKQLHVAANILTPLKELLQIQRSVHTQSPPPKPTPKPISRVTQKKEEKKKNLTLPIPHQAVVQLAPGASARKDHGNWRMQRLKQFYSHLVFLYIYSAKKDKLTVLEANIQFYSQLKHFTQLVVELHLYNNKPQAEQFRLGDNSFTIFGDKSKADATTDLRNMVLKSLELLAMDPKFKSSVQETIPILLEDFTVHITKKIREFDNNFISYINRNCEDSEIDDVVFDKLRSAYPLSSDISWQLDASKPLIIDQLPIFKILKEWQEEMLPSKKSVKPKDEKSGPKPPTQNIAKKEHKNKRKKLDPEAIAKNKAINHEMTIRYVLIPFLVEISQLKLVTSDPTQVYKMVDFSKVKSDPMLGHARQYFDAITMVIVICGGNSVPEGSDLKPIVDKCRKIRNLVGHNKEQEISDLAQLLKQIVSFYQQSSVGASSAMDFRMK